MEQIKSEKLSREFKINIGDWLYTMEFGDGSSIEVPEVYLEKYQSHVSNIKMNSKFTWGDTVVIKKSAPAIPLVIEESV